MKEVAGRVFETAVLRCQRILNLYSLLKNQNFYDKVVIFTSEVLGFVFRLLYLYYIKKLLNNLVRKEMQKKTFEDLSFNGQVNVIC